MPSTKKYTSIAEVQEFWINNIATKFFDFDNVNNYRSGIFGYINEVMSTVTMDAFNSINLARREFYPVTAQNPKSLYKMAALQQIDLPLTIPATCNAVLILDQDEVINNSSYKNGSYTCVIDSTVQILAGDIPFSILYPIIIISTNIDGEWNHTIHYDKSMKNSLDDDNSSSYHIINKVINKDGKRYMLLAVQLTQTKRESLSELITKDTSIDTVSLLFNFEGDLANFEVFYIEDPDSSKPIQLEKLLNGQASVKNPFCYYRMLGDTQLELTFPKSAYFTPEINSEIRVDIYTSLGNKGEFPSFNGSLVCTMSSEDYPYNNNMHMLGTIDGSSLMGEDKPTLEEYTKTIQIAYATNDTITITNDLQLFFDKISNSYNKVIFRKKRDDAFDREFGAYALIKTSSGDIVPTNTLSINTFLSEFDSNNGISHPAFIKPGAIFEYDGNVDSNGIYTARKVNPLETSLLDDLSEYDGASDRFLYTNPFLIYVTLYPNFIQYFNTSIHDTMVIEYTYTNDSSIVQFIGGDFKISRNSLFGENFYEISIRVSPTIEIPTSEVVSIPNEENDEDYYFRAEQNGIVKSILYEDGEEGDTSVICTLLYEDGSEDIIPVSSYVVNEESEYIYNIGYKLNVHVFDSFIKGDILGIKKVTDMGKIRACLNFKNILYENGFYIPMVIEEYDESLNSFIMRGYISTDDVLDNDGHILLDHGIYDENGHEDDEISITYKGLRMEVNIFYHHDDTNFAHKYSNFDYFQDFTLANTYQESSDNGINLVESVDYIRSTLIFTTEDPDEDDEEEYDDAGIAMTLKEVPLVKANWIKDYDNFMYFIDSIISNYKNLLFISKKLENGFGFDLKFYNSYGKSRFFRVGIRNEWQPLSRVDSSFRFGVYLISSTISQSSFLESFRKYVKNAVEEINNKANEGQSIYILNLIANIEKEFAEIGYMEYYGFNEYSNNIQKIEPISISKTDHALLMNYIPEFINVGTYKENNQLIPNISVDFLNESTEEDIQIERMV